MKPVCLTRLLYVLCDMSNQSLLKIDREVAIL